MDNEDILPHNFVGREYPKRTTYHGAVMEWSEDSHGKRVGLIRLTIKDSVRYFSTFKGAKKYTDELK